MIVTSLALHSPLTPQEWQRKQYKHVLIRTWAGAKPWIQWVDKLNTGPVDTGWVKETKEASIPFRDN